MTIIELINAKKNYYKFFTKEASLKAVEQDGYALQYVKEQDKDICLKAVERNGHALQYVKEQELLIEKEITISEIEF